MAVRTLNAETINEVLGDNGTIVIIFRADWCGPCELFERDYRRVAQRNDDVIFSVVDVEHNPDIADDFEVQMVPTLVIIRNRTLLFSHSGRVSSSALEDLLHQVREVKVEEFQ